MKSLALVGVILAASLCAGCGMLENAKLGDAKIGRVALPDQLPGEDLARQAGYGFVVDLYRRYVDQAQGVKLPDGYTPRFVVLNTDRQPVDVTGWSIREILEKETIIGSSAEFAEKLRTPSIPVSALLPTAPGGLQDLDNANLTDDERDALRKVLGQ